MAKLSDMPSEQLMKAIADTERIEGASASLAILLRERSRRIQVAMQQVRDIATARQLERERPMTKNPMKPRAPSVKRPDRIGSLIGKCSIDEIGDLARSLVARNRNVAGFVASAIEQELRRPASTPAIPAPPDSGPRTGTADIGGIKFPVSVS